MNGNYMLLILIVVGLAGRSNIITTAACVLLAVKLLSLDRYLPALERRGLELGLLFLTIGVLVPFASGKITFRDIGSVLLTVPGVMALTGGAMAAYMNGRGLEMLRLDPQIVIGLVIGSIFGIVFLRGIPVGPLMAAGLTALLLKLFQFLFGRFL
ncbi:DUF441 domain-containing protein [Gorillibacterium sp. sgz500922]|uniref:DUF441 domain-containing protein n=1 Tax=Gorillibacterium sp. sgz500922 TaxID=3446694 RepID=UPI003F6683B0